MIAAGQLLFLDRRFRLLVVWCAESLGRGLVWAFWVSMGAYVGMVAMAEKLDHPVDQGEAVAALGPRFVWLLLAGYGLLFVSRRLRGVWRLARWH